MKEVEKDTGLSKSKTDIYKIILEDALAGYWDWNIQDNTEFMSPRFKEMLGYEDHELSNVPQSWQKLIFEEDLEKVLRNFDEHVKSHGQIPFHIEVRYHHKKGHTIWILCTGRVLEWGPSGEPIRMVGCHIDITNQKRVEHDLKVSETRFKGAFEYSAIGMALVSTEGKWLRVNKRLCQILGYTSEEMLTKNFQEITHPDDLDLDLKHLNKMLNGEVEFYQMEKRYFHASGHILWVMLSVSMVRDLNGELLYFVSQIEDITKRKAAEQALVKANLELSGILSATTQVALISSDVYGTVTHFNVGAENLLQYTADEVVHRENMLKFHLWSEVDEHATHLTRVFGRKISGFDALVEYARQGDYESRQWNYIRKDGSHFPVEMVITPIRDGEDEITGFLAVAVDVTDRVKRKNELHKAKEELEALTVRLKKQNTQLGDFAHITSHNLRAPVSNLSSLLMMHNTLADPEEKEDLLEKFKTVTEHLYDTLNELTETLKITDNPNIPRQNLKFKNTFQKTLEILSGQILETGAQITGDFSAAPELCYHRSYLESIFLNLISNALKYRSPQRTPIIHARSWEEKGEMKLSVTDNGLGIDMKRQAHKLFGLHKTFHRNKASRGVGLFVTRAQVESQGGEISATSEVDKGSTFTVTFNKIG